MTGSLSRPADVFLPSWSCGRPAALDIHVISPLQQQTLSVLLSPRVMLFRSGYSEAGVECIPIVAETLGGLAEDAIFTVRSLGRAIADRAGSMDSISTTRHIFQRFAIALWRGNACLWLHRHPTLPSYLDGVA